MTEATGVPGLPIRRGAGSSAGSPLYCDLLVVDETSMVDVLLMQVLLKAVPGKAAILIVGCPRSGRGRSSPTFNTTRCPWFASPIRQAAQRRIHRPPDQSAIPDLSPPGTDSDFYFVQAEEPEFAVARIVELVKTKIPRRFGLDPIGDIRVLCPMNRGGVGARVLNLELQAAATMPTTRSGGQRPKSAKARNRGGLGTEGAA
jgi:exodeoxyribonuclease V alpha subunit